MTIILIDKLTRMHNGKAIARILICCATSTSIHVAYQNLVQINPKFSKIRNCKFEEEEKQTKNVRRLHKKMKYIQQK